MRRLRNDRKVQGIKTKEITCNLIIDYEELEKGRDYFSYNE
jgi:hypothetical protein